ncbi:DUF397 domain-containing protein [Streptomyces sp. NPDC059786]|uniref:DUF397 domain-containing protein n=1 Tax=Streptomyces sp. NPDC059786 TaxID=3346946 RepID=UPI003646B9B3
MNDHLTWFKSSYSDSEGSNCVEVAYAWHKSSYGDSSGSACLEVAHDQPMSGRPVTHVRDSKLGGRGPEIAIPGRAWAAFVAHARSV